MFRVSEAHARLARRTEAGEEDAVFACHYYEQVRGRPATDTGLHCSVETR